MMDENQPITEEEREGIKMIIALQAKAGFVEPEADALVSWRAMSEDDRIQTKWAYALFFG